MELAAPPRQPNLIRTIVNPDRHGKGEGHQDTG